MHPLANNEPICNHVPNHVSLCLPCRGIYLACVLYHEDKLLLTNEDFVPVIEIDETFTSNLHTDFYWLMKVSPSIPASGAVQPR